MYEGTIETINWKWVLNFQWQLFGLNLRNRVVGGFYNLGSCSGECWHQSQQASFGVWQNTLLDLHVRCTFGALVLLKNCGTCIWGRGAGCRKDDHPWYLLAPSTNVLLCHTACRLDWSRRSVESGGHMICEMIFEPYIWGCRKLKWLLKT